MMTSAQVVETSVNVTSNSPSQDYTHPDDHNLPNYDMTPGFKPFTRIYIYIYADFLFSTFRLIMTRERSKRREFLQLVFIVNYHYNFDIAF